MVDAYVRRLIKDGWTLEFFLEGGRSRTGKLLSPKVGLLSLVVDAALGVERPVYFVPISIGYERVVEEKAFVSELTGGEKKQEDMRGLLASANAIAATLRPPQRPVRGDPHSSGGPPRGRSARHPRRRREAHPGEAPSARDPGRVPRDERDQLGHRGHAGRARGHGPPHARPPRPPPRRSRARVRADRGDPLRRFGARFTPSLTHPQNPEGIRIDAVREACDLFILAGNLDVRTPGDDPGRSGKRGKDPRAARDAIYVVPDAARLSLDLSKNIVLHSSSPARWSPPRSRSPGAPTELEPLRERVRALSRLFKYEFQFRADAPFEQIFEETIEAMVHDGELSREGDVLDLAGGEDERANVALYAQVVRNFIEGYRVAARGLGLLLRGSLAPKDPPKTSARARRSDVPLRGDRTKRSGEPALFENAHSAFVDQGYLVREDGKLALAESYDSQAAVRTIEARIAGFLPTRGGS